MHLFAYLTFEVSSRPKRYGVKPWRAVAQI